MRKVFTQSNPPKYKGEVNSGINHTVPDQTLSIRKILDMYARGVPANATVKDPVYNENYPYMSPNHYDLTEVDDMREELKDYQEEGKKTLEKLEKAKVDLLKKEEMEKLKPKENE